LVFLFVDPNTKIIFFFHQRFAAGSQKVHGLCSYCPSSVVLLTTSCCDVMSRNLRGCEMSSRLYIGCIRVVAFCSSNSQKIKDWYSIATIAGWKKIKNILKISWKTLTLRDWDAPLGAVSGKKLKAETSHAWADGQLLNRTYRRRSAINQSVP
jgi:hypothetical protein